jgi:hypothetical protein
LRDTILLADVDLPLALVLRILSEPVALAVFFLATVNFLPGLRFSEARSIDKRFSVGGQNDSNVLKCAWRKARLSINFTPCGISFLDGS